MSHAVTVRGVQRLLTILPILAAACGAFRVDATLAQCPENLDRILSADGGAGHQFGTSVSLDGSAGIIGAPYDDHIGREAGSAYAYAIDASGSHGEQKLLPSDGAAGDRFGISVSVSGDLAIVGAYRDDDRGADSGSAYVFRFTGSRWVEEQKLVVTDGSAGDVFGFSVGISGDVAVVGSALHDSQGTDAGAAYVFRKVGSRWIQEQKLVAPDAEPNDLFGVRVAISNDVIVVGAIRDSDLGKDSGSAHVYRFAGSSWVHEQKLFASDGAANDWFGFSVAVDGDVVVVGSQLDDDRGGGSGSAYVFGFNGTRWIEEGKLLASDGALGDRFGTSVAVFGDTIVVGSPSRDMVGLWNTGAAYVFRLISGTWLEESRLANPDGYFNDQFGNAVTVSEGIVLIGAFNDNARGLNSGSAYVVGLCQAGGAGEEPADAPPTVILTSPSDGAILSGTVTVAASAFDDQRIQQVEFLVDGSRQWTDWTSPYAFTWDTTRASGGGHTITVRASDPAGNVAVDSVSVTVSNAAPDTTPPSTVITNPGSGAIVSGTVGVSARASDHEGIRQVEFLIDGVRRATDTTSPYSFMWDTTGQSDGSHTLTVRATDTSGNVATDRITVTVANDAPSDTEPASIVVTMPADGAVVSGAVWVMAEVVEGDDPVRVDFFVDGVLTRVFSTSPYIWLWDTTRRPDGIHTLTVEGVAASGATNQHSISVTVDN